MTDTSTDTQTTRKPEDFLAPISGQVPWMLLIGVYLIAFLLILQLFKKSY